MTNHNLIYYQSTGQDSFNCNFQLLDANELEVYIEQALKTYLLDYTIAYLHAPVQRVKFNYPVGSVDSPVMVLLKFRPNPKRMCSFQNSTQIRSEALNAELNNVWKFNTYLQDNVERAVKIPVYNQQELILPHSNAGKGLIWSNDGNLTNSQENIDATLHTLLTFMEEVQTNGGTGNNSGESNGGGTSSESLDSKDVIYSGGQLVANNVENALHALKDSANININVPNLIAQNVNDGLQEVSVAKGITYSNESLNCNNVDAALNLLNQKIDDVIAGTIPLTNQYKGIKHGLISGELSNLGWAGFLTAKDSFQITVLGKNIPLQIAFSSFLSTTVVDYNQNLNLQFPKTVGVYYYIYADYNTNGQVTINYTQHKPYYLGYARSNNVDDKIMLLIDTYKEPSDWFNLSNYTMYNFNNQPIHRVYLGQVIFAVDGTPAHLINYNYGDCYCVDVKIMSNVAQKIFKIYNLFGTELVQVDVKFKNTLPFDEASSYSYNLNRIATDSSLEIGMNYSVNSQFITGTFGNPHSAWYFSNPTDYWNASGGFARFHIKRLF